MKLKLLGDRVLLKYVEVEEKGIILPDSAKKNHEYMTVVAVGDGKTSKNGNLIPIPVSVGDTVMIEKYSGQEISIENEKYVVTKSDNIFGVIS